MSGSRFFLCDLQVHTPADNHHGYGDFGGRDPSRGFCERLIEAHARAGVRVLAVSDHNRVDWYPLLREVGDEHGVWVFPALEFSVNRCHLLTVWDRTAQGYALAQQFLGTLWSPGEDPFAPNGDPRPVGSGGVRDLAQRAAEHKALVLAPHATMQDIGLFGRGVVTNRREVIESGLIAGFDVWGNRMCDTLSNPAGEFGIATPRWFISGDVRRFEDVGKRAVFLKLGAEPTLEGLRQAFLMPETRIRFPEAHREAWGRTVGVRFTESVEPTWPRITSVRIDGGFHDGLDLELAPGLNAIIGGKGTGKSTLVEILRHTLHAGSPTSQELRGNREQNFKANAEAHITFTDAAGIDYAVTRTGSTSTSARLHRGDQLLDVEIAKRVAIRVFGQRELQAMADDPDQLRQFISAECGDGWLSEAEAERDVLLALKQVNAQISDAETGISGADEDEHELADITDKIETAIERGAGEHAARLEALGIADDAVSDALAWPARMQDSADDLRDVPAPAAVPDTVPQGTAIHAILSDLQALANDTASAISAAITKGQEGLKGLAAEWDSFAAAERAEIERQLADAGLADVRELAALQARARTLRTALAGLPERRARLGDLLTHRQGLLERLGQVRRKQSRLIEEATKRLNQRVGQRVRVRTDPLADTSNLIATLDTAVRGQSVRTDQLRRLADDHGPAALVEAIRCGPNSVEALGCSAATAAKLCAIEPSVLRTIEETPTPDLVLVEVNLSDLDTPETWHDVTEVSPGQRATALLALVLAAGSEPLVIDQPEDDLDNRYIYDEVVSVLAGVCERRQVIVATHNANIPVLGDAELVVALDARAERSEVLAAGGLEDSDVADWCRRILEGGEVAFRQRHQRYEQTGP